MMYVTRIMLLLLVSGVFSLSVMAQAGTDTAKKQIGQGTSSQAEIEKKGQEQQLAAWQSQTKQYVGLLPTFFEKDSTRGSPYLSSKWMRGAVEMFDHRRIPKANENLYFNYDKFKRRLISTDTYNEIIEYPMDEILAFALADEEKAYLFEKIYYISKDFFLEPVLKSDKGFSLYKRLITKLNTANYKSDGYYSTGKKFDEYTDDYEYYLLSPDKKSYRKFYLKEPAIRKVFKDEQKLLDDLLKSPVTEAELVSIVEAINASISH
jgi:hypothetical protein